MRWIRTATWLAALLALVVLGLTLVLSRDAAGTPVPPWLGTRPEVLARAGEGPAEEPYRFAVLGDAQGTDVGADLIRALGSYEPDFLILTGDVIRSGKPGYHARAARWFTEVGGLGFPVFWVPGNRDIKPGEFEVEDFEARYGPTQWWLSHKGDLFIGLRHPDPLWDWLEPREFLRETLAAQRAGHRRVFVFTHVPPAVSEVLEFPRGGRGMLPHVSPHIVADCEELGVDYWIAAHHHGYLRREKNGVVYLVSGGGGGSFHAGGNGAFNHGLLVESGPEGVAESLITTVGGVEGDHGPDGVLPAHVGGEDLVGLEFASDSDRAALLDRLKTDPLLRHSHRELSPEALSRML